MRFVAIFLGFCIYVACANPALAEKRVALVIGNSAYMHAPELTNPKNDASDMAVALKALGLEVIEGIDLGKAGLEQKIREFSIALQEADVGVFFYAGHGLQVNGNNYLVPVDAELSTVAALEFEMIRLDAVQRLMENSAKTNILFLDACRNNPLSRNLARAMGTRAAAIGRGLAPAESGVGTLISYSTQPGNVALDGKGRNSPFAGPLAKAIGTAGEDVLSVLTRVRNDVLAATGEKQVPWENHALRARFYFNPAQPPEPAPQVPAFTPPALTASDAAQAWATVQSSENTTVLDAFRKQFGASHPFYDSLAVSRIAAVNEAAESKRKADDAKRAEAAASKKVEDEKKVALLVQADLAKAAAATGKDKLIRDIQRELARVGCGLDVKNGIWDGKSKAAILEFSRHSRIALAVDEPTSMSLNAVMEKKSRVCPLHCGKDQIETNGRCVDEPKPVRVQNEQKERPRPPRPEAARQQAPKAPEGVPLNAFCSSNVVLPSGVMSASACDR